MISSDRISLQSESLQRLYAQGVILARRRQAPTLVSLTYAVPWRDPLDLLYNAESMQLERSFWCVPHREFTLLGVGCAQALVGHGAERFTEVSRAWRSLTTDALIDNSADRPGTGPILMGGFSFDPLRSQSEMWHGFPDAGLVLPSITVTLGKAEAWLTHNIVISPEQDTDVVEDNMRLAEALWSFDHGSINQVASGIVHVDDAQANEWMEQVAQVAAVLNDGALEKVVLARAVIAQADDPFHTQQALAFLRSAYPDCFLFGFTRGNRTFLGATPEQLIRLTGGSIETMCLAGSISRGDTSAEDAALGQALLRDAKERREHALVLESLQNDLSDVCEDMQHPEAPTLLRLGNVQHLFTPVQAKCRPGYTVFDVLERLHPTPAVGGSPRKPAMEMIRSRETFDRGWYASPVGWLDARSDGEFAVALRCALIQEEQAVLFAGCGIMPTSDSVREYHESCLKLRPMLSALGGHA